MTYSSHIKLTMQDQRVHAFINIKDFIEGQIEFSSITLSVKSMELILVRKEILGSGEREEVQINEIYNYEIMDGCPINGYLNRRSNPDSVPAISCPSFDPNLPKSLK